MNSPVTHNPKEDAFYERVDPRRMTRRFPILNTVSDSSHIKSIPWSLIAPHEAQALRNHCDQSLERLAQRGGLSPCEAVAVLEDVDYRKRWPRIIFSREDREKHHSAAVTRLMELIEACERTTP